MSDCNHRPLRYEGNLWSCLKCDTHFSIEPKEKSCPKHKDPLVVEFCIYWLCAACDVVVGRGT